MVAILLLALAAGFMVWQRVQATRLGYAVETARSRVRSLQGQLMSQGMEWEKAVAPAQIAHHARTRLQMQPAAPDVIRIPESAASAGGSPSGAWPLSRELLSAVRQGISALRRPI
jgi:hypothetical protein